MSEWSLQDWLTFIGAVSAAALAFYTSIVRPLLTQIKELIVALKANTASTDTSATALTELKPAVVANTVATAAVAGTGDGGNLTVNVATPPTP